MSILLQAHELPPFGHIDIDEIEPTLDRLLDESRVLLDRLLELEQPGWSSLMVPWLAQEERLSEFWSPIAHLHGVANTERLRPVYEACVVKLSAWYTEVGQNRAWYEAVRRLANGPEAAGYSQAQRKLLQDMLQDFELSGVALDDAARKRFAENRQALTRLSTTFANHVMDATEGWHLLVQDEKRLAGLPEDARKQLADNARRAGQQGWRLQLDMPSYMPVISYAEDRSLRRQLYEAFATRASDRGPQAGRWDNGPVMLEILRLRQQQAELLGRPHFAALSLATKMARDAAEVERFLQRLVVPARKAALADLERLRRFAREELGLERLEAWDLPYASEKLREARYQLNEEMLRPYFPLPRVLQGMLDIAGELFGLRFRLREGVEAWHEDVQFWDIFDASDGRHLAGFYLDPYARDKKQGGAWMDVCRSRHRLGSRQQYPVAYLNCNFPPPVQGQPSLLRHDDVITLFHEFGHGLHHMLTRVEWPPVSGISGVEWDAVELPSQFMENFCWQRQGVDRIAAHHETGEPLPDALFRRMLAARHFQSGMVLVRQLEFALFDIRLHQLERFDEHTVMHVLQQVRQEVAVVDYPAWNRFPHGFSHIFGGGYAAGYYSYLWAEQLAADAFALFEEQGVFNPDTGRRFRGEILEVGGSRPAAESFRAFRGRDPEIGPLLRSHGIGYNGPESPSTVNTA